MATVSYSLNSNTWTELVEAGELTDDHFVLQNTQNVMVLYKFGSASTAALKLGYLGTAIRGGVPGKVYAKAMNEGSKTELVVAGSVT